jgi:N-acetylglucosamine kinase-like BadF-type ATPase
VPYFLGIDGGGTKTTCAVGDESQVLATATTGPSNIIRVGGDQTCESLKQAVRQACDRAGILLEQVIRTCVGAAGAGRPNLATTVRGFLAEILSSPIDVVGDLETALDAAFDTGSGVVVNAGTGSFAYGRDRRGNTARAGGWGFAIGDEGSAHWIGREAVRAILRESDNTRGTAEISRHEQFATDLCQRWRVASLLDLARTANSVPPPDFAALFPAVAASEDSLALKVRSLAGTELARIAALVSQRLFPNDQIKTVPVAMVGGVFRYSKLTKDDFYNELRRLDPRVEISPLIVEPVQGALRMARRAAGSA